MVTKPTQPAADAAAEDEEEAKRRQLESARGMLSGLNPLNWDFGSMVMFGIVAIGLFLGFTTNRGKDLMSKARDLFSDLFSGVKDWFIKTFPSAALAFAPEEVQEAEKEFPGATVALTDIAAAHGASRTDPFGDANKAPDILFESLIDARTSGYMRKLASTGKGSVPTEDSKKVLAAAKTMLADTAKLRSLLSPEHRANTFALLEAASPIPFPPGRLGAFITKVGIYASGEPTPLLQQTIDALLNENASARAPLLKNLLNTVDQPTAKALLEGINLAQVPKEYRGIVQHAQTVTGTPETFQQAKQALNAAPPAVSEKLMAVLPNGKAAVLNLVAQDKEVRDFVRSDVALQSLPQYRDTLVQLRRTSDAQIVALARIENHFVAHNSSFLSIGERLMQKQANGQSASAAQLTDRVIDLALDSSKRALFMDGGVTRELATILREEAKKPDHAAHRASMNFLGHMEGNQAWNLNLTFKLVDRLTAQPNQLPPKQLKQTLKNLMQATSGDANAKLDLQAMSQFLRVPGNAVLVGNYLRSLKLNDLPPASRDKVTTLVQHWSAAVAMATNPESLAYLQDKMNGCGPAQAVPEAGSVQGWFAKTFVLPKAMGDRLPELGALAKIADSAHDAKTPCPTPSWAANAPLIHTI